MFFKHHKRFEHDERIVLVDKIKDIPSCGRSFSRVNGVLCPYTMFSPEEEKAVRAFMDRLPSAKGTARASSMHYNESRGNAPEPLLRAFSELSRIFKRCTGVEAGVQLRLNSTHPQKPHQHEPAMTYTLSGSGTIGYTMRGKKYHVPDKHLFIFDKQIPHMAAQDFSYHQPRLTFVVSPDLLHVL